MFCVHKLYTLRMYTGARLGLVSFRSPGLNPGPRHTERQRPRIRSGAALCLIRGSRISLGATWVSPTLREDASVGRGLPRHTMSCGTGVSGRTSTYAEAPVGRGSPRQRWRCPHQTPRPASPGSARPPPGGRFCDGGGVMTVSRFEGVGCAREGANALHVVRCPRV